MIIFSACRYSPSGHFRQYDISEHHPLLHEIAHEEEDRIDDDLGGRLIGAGEEMHEEGQAAAAGKHPQAQGRLVQQLLREEAA